MHVVVYLDVLFGVNLLMNGIVLACMKLCLREKTTWLRWLIASFMGAILYCIAFFSPFQKNHFGYGLYFILVAAVMIKIAFFVKGWKKWAAYIGAQYVIAGILGGLINGIYYGWRIKTPIQTAWMAGMGRTYQEPKIIDFLITVFITSFIFYFSSRFFYRKKQRDDGRYQAFLSLGRQTGTVKALLDTGNSLTEPVSHAPVIIGDLTGLRELFDKEEQKQIKEFYKTGFYKGEKKIRLIPYHAVGVKTGILISYLMDEVVLWKEEESIIRKKGVYLAVSPICISSDGSYQLLLHPGVLS